MIFNDDSNQLIIINYITIRPNATWAGLFCPNLKQLL